SAGFSMLDATAKKLLRLLQTSSSADMRAAVIRVIGEIGLRDKQAATVLTAALDDPEGAVRTASLEAGGKLRIEQALPVLLDRIVQGGPESELAAQSAAHLGAKGASAMRELMSKVAPGLRRRIAGALAAVESASGSPAAVEALLDTDPGVID